MGKVMDDPIEDFKSRIEAFLVEMEMPAWKFGLTAMRDNVFVHSLREGRRPRAATIAKLDEWMERYRASERDRDAQALGKIRALRGGTVILDSEGKPENLPQSVSGSAGFYNDEAAIGLGATIRLDETWQLGGSVASDVDGKNVAGKGVITGQW